ncbi:hypothetical protein T01_236 [Trichinella spiralis]|uniref:Uncharacterized protein n=1 Tax=Trichinella spiralis TaxID=6334 RepID=A0A0V1BJD6_TRISP|nr:hypothetical protein T01_236 [Trichinella spiralis]
MSVWCCSTSTDLVVPPGAVGNFPLNNSTNTIKQDYICKTISYFILINMGKLQSSENLKIARDILKVAIEAFLWDEEFLLIIVKFSISPAREIQEKLTDAEFVAWISLNFNWYWRRPSLR